MWLLPWNVNSDFYSQYRIGEHVTAHEGSSIWTLFDVERKSNGENLSLFRIDFKEPNSNLKLLELAKQSIKRMKTLRHPSILKYVDSLESEKSVCIITERARPLSHYMEHTANHFSNPQKDFFIAYGLINVAKGLKFINDDCQLNHNNINIHSIFVNAAGMWKIGNLEYICPHGEIPPPRIDKLSEKYTPPERLDPDKVRVPGGKFAVDSWGMGCLVWESFNKPITEGSSIKTVGKMPKPLALHYNKLVQSSPRHRISPLDFIEQSKKANVIFNTSLLEVMTTLEEIHLIKDQSEKAKFFAKLEKELASFPNDFCKFKILPDLMTAFEYGEAGSAILNPIFSIDRATRSKLLQQLESYIKLLPPNTTNEVIFPQIIHGFLDSNLTIREQTIKSMLHLAPHLNQSNLNDELIKHLTRIQTNDSEGGIRANATVCLGKIAKHFDDTIIQMQLVVSLLKMLRDNFAPARQAAIAALSANESLFNSKNCAMKIMPALCPTTTDPTLNVRKLAIKSLRLFLDRMDAESEGENSTDKDQKNSSEIAGGVSKDHGNVSGSVNQLDRTDQLGRSNSKVN